ncbi:acyltransferase family protein [Leminorella grimontii]|uniref:acyltransferase family protein n=1 Tax=Leminorella grimontii TaxID=82981 RepID=UPI002087B5CB|nr:acyltransferase [Leminorella grimontii]GKX60636.1 acyltransferase [Leminorella grimontii]
MSSTKVRLDYLDGIRGWAAAIVVFGHTMGGVISIDAPKYVDHVWLRFLTNAHLSVLVFFVLSGYVLSVSQIFSSKRNTAVSTVARLFRLSFPILLISFVAYIMMRLDLFYNTQAATTDAAKSWLGRFFVFEPNLFDVLKFSFFDVFFSYNEQATYNSSLWTMPIEMFGSLLIYSYIAIFRKENPNWIISIALIIYFYNFNPFMFCFMVGYILAELRLNNNFVVTGVKDYLMIVAFLVMIYIDTYHRPIGEIYQAVEAVVFVVIISYSGVLSKIFSSKISRFMGKISFSLYLVQIVVICSWSSIMKIYLSSIGINVNLAATLNLITTMLLCIVLARIMSPVDDWSVKASKIIAEKIINIPKYLVTSKENA